MNWQRTAAALFATCGVVGCAGSAPAPVPSPSATCGTVRPIPADEQHRISAAIRAVPADSPLAMPLLDWEQMRVEARACRRAAGGK